MGTSLHEYDFTSVRDELKARYGPPTSEQRERDDSVRYVLFAFRLAAQYFFIRELTAFRAAADILRRCRRRPWTVGSSSGKFSLEFLITMFCTALGEFEDVKRMLCGGRPSAARSEASCKNFAATRRLFKGDLLREQLDRLWSYTTRDGVARFLFGWLKALRWQRLPEIEKLGDTLVNHVDGIATYCDHPVRFGVVESLNATIKAVLRRARGMRDDAMLLLATYRFLPITGESFRLRCYVQPRFNGGALHARRTTNGAEG